MPARPLPLKGPRPGKPSHKPLRLPTAANPCKACKGCKACSPCTACTAGGPAFCPFQHPARAEACRQAALLDESTQRKQPAGGEAQHEASASIQRLVGESSFGRTAHLPQQPAGAGVEAAAQTADHYGGPRGHHGAAAGDADQACGAAGRRGRGNVKRPRCARHGSEAAQRSSPARGAATAQLPVVLTRRAGRGRV